MSFKQNFKRFIETQVESAVDLIFSSAHAYAMSDSGDITPEQASELDAIKEQLRTLVYEQTVQNLTEEQLKDLKLDSPSDEESEEVLWNVPVTRVGYGYSLVAVNARSEQEAIEKALDAAGDEEYSEKSSEYIAPDGAHKIG